MTPEDRDELARLRRRVEGCSLGDRPPSPAAAALRRLIELEGAEAAARAARAGGEDRENGGARPLKGETLKLDKERLKQKLDVAERLKKAVEAAEAAAAAYEAVVEDARQFAAEVGEDARARLEDKSERAQESEASQALGAFAEAYENFDLPDLDLPDLGEALDSFEELPESSS